LYQSRIKKRFWSPTYYCTAMYCVPYRTASSANKLKQPSRALREGPNYPIASADFARVPPAREPITAFVLPCPSKRKERESTHPPSELKTYSGLCALYIHKQSIQCRRKLEILVVFLCRHNRVISSREGWNVRSLDQCMT
jgi:hypothetical protein